MHKARALEQYESVATEAARLAAVEADLRAQNASLASKMREQAAFIREQRAEQHKTAAAVAELQQQAAAAATVEVLKEEVERERALGGEMAARIEKLEKVKLTTDKLE